MTPFSQFLEPPGNPGRFIQTNKRRVGISQLGSDENALSLHIAAALTFHRLFDERYRPVPGLLVVDQLSRPYFGDSGDEEDFTGADKAALEAYVRMLINESTAQGLQVILLEHARMRWNGPYREAIVEEWEQGVGLVPQDWPRD